MQKRNAESKPIYAFCVEKFILLLFDAFTLQNIYENNFYFDAAAGFYEERMKKNAAARICV